MSLALLNVNAARRRCRRRLREAVLDELQREYGLRYRAAAERALVDVESMDVVSYAFLEGEAAVPSNAPAVAERFATAFDAGTV